MLVLGGLGVPLFPEDGTFILYGFLTHAQVVKLFPAFLVVYVGALLADLMIYAFGWKYGRRIVTHRWFHRFLPPAKFITLQDKFNRKGSLFILLGRQILGLRVQLFLVSGIMRMPLRKFLTVDGLTVILTISIWAAVGYGGAYFLGDVDLHQSKIQTVLLLLSKLRS
jgi:membrane protein DedA with SNARE-associated domain